MRPRKSSRFSLAREGRLFSLPLFTALLISLSALSGFFSQRAEAFYGECISYEPSGEVDFKQSVQTFIEWRKNDEEAGRLGGAEREIESAFERYETKSEACLNALVDQYLSLASYKNPSGGSKKWESAIQELGTLVSLHPKFVLELIYRIERAWESDAGFYLPYATALRMRAKDIHAQTQLLRFVIGGSYLVLGHAGGMGGATGAGASGRTLDMLRYLDLKKAFLAAGVSSGVLSGSYLAQEKLLLHKDFPLPPSQLIPLMVIPEIQLLARAEELRETEEYYSVGASGVVLGTLMATRLARVGTLARSLGGALRVSGKALQRTPKGLISLIADPLIWVGSEWLASELQETVQKRSLAQALIQKAGSLNRAVRERADEMTLLQHGVEFVEQALLYEFYQNQPLLTADLEARMEYRKGEPVSDVLKNHRKRLKGVQKDHFSSTPEWFKRYRLRREIREAILNPLLNERREAIESFIHSLEANGTQNEAEYVRHLMQQIRRHADFMAPVKGSTRKNAEAASGVNPQVAFEITLHNLGIQDERIVKAEFYYGKIQARPDAFWAQIEIILKRTGVKTITEHLIPIYIEPRLNRYFGAYGVFETMNLDGEGALPWPI